MPNKRAEGVSVHNVALDTALWNAAKEKAHGEGRSLTAVIAKLLTEWLGW